ncbi:polysaccharide pyruvyl transferase family protein [Marinobacter salarius]|uniref:polysaccharide pyruvyl transferase family protein n=1 Tax=Marinobacter salarius TaxID=1420917 RepID=UPI003BAC9178
MKNLNRSNSKFMNSRVCRLCRDAFASIFFRNYVPLVYFSEIKNVGDLISPYLTERITNKRVRCVETSVLPRLLGVGSILGNGSFNSYIWGSGSINGQLPNRKLDPKKIFAVRGKLTLALLESRYKVAENLPLGDPALLMPRFFKPLSGIQFRVGIVPHYVDADQAEYLLRKCQSDFTIIDVRQDPETFISKIAECELILSSSLHGLILADAYGIPNRWVRFSDSIVGGFWKFLDYYSITDNHSPSPLQISQVADIFNSIEEPEKVFRVSHNKCSLDRLYESFPVEAFCQ